mmetsp:Transcript_19719/g.68367  ORF Transcript_19719/g.68367 Transcript_19719/m.68367 type:complete len:298 (+) Transcript_19719:821-1714(+)
MDRPQYIDASGCPSDRLRNRSSSPCQQNLVPRAARRHPGRRLIAERRRRDDKRKVHVTMPFVNEFGLSSTVSDEKAVTFFGTAKIVVKPIALEPNGPVVFIQASLGSGITGQHKRKVCVVLHLLDRQREFTFDRRERGVFEMHHGNEWIVHRSCGRSLPKIIRRRDKSRFHDPIRLKCFRGFKLDGPAATGDHFLNDSSVCAHAWHFADVVDKHHFALACPAIGVILVVNYEWEFFSFLELAVNDEAACQDTRGRRRPGERERKTHRSQRCVEIGVIRDGNIANVVVWSRSDAEQSQ